MTTPTEDDHYAAIHRELDNQLRIQRQALRFYAVAIVLASLMLAGAIIGAVTT